MEQVMAESVTRIIRPYQPCHIQKIDQDKSYSGPVSAERAELSPEIAPGQPVDCQNYLTDRQQVP